MRLAHSAQLETGAVPIENIHTGAKSRDDIPAILLGLRHLCASKALRRRVFELLEAEVAPAARKDAGRPGMDLWRILALACPSRGSAATSTGWRTWPIMTGWCAGCRGIHRRSGMPASSRRRSTTSRFRVRSCCPGSGGWWPGRAARRPEKSLASRCAGNGIHLRKRVHSLKKAHRSAGRPAAMLPAAPPCLICGSGCGSGRRGASTLSDTTVRAASCRCKRRCPRQYSRPLRRPAAHARARPPRGGRATVASAFLKFACTAAPSSAQAPTGCGGGSPGCDRRHLRRASLPGSARATRSLSPLSMNRSNCAAPLRCRRFAQSTFRRTWSHRSSNGQQPRSQAATSPALRRGGCVAARLRSQRRAESSKSIGMRSSGRCRQLHRPCGQRAPGLGRLQPSSSSSRGTLILAPSTRTAAGCSCGSGAPSRRHWSRSSPGATRQLRRLRENAGRNTNSAASSVPIVRRRRDFSCACAARGAGPLSHRPAAPSDARPWAPCPCCGRPRCGRHAPSPRRDSAWLARFSARTRGRTGSLELQTARSSRRSDLPPSRPIRSSRRRSLFEARWNSRHPSRRPSPATMKQLRWRPAGRHAPARGSGPPARRTAPGFNFAMLSSIFESPRLHPPAQRAQAFEQSIIEYAEAIADPLGEKVRAGPPFPHCQRLASARKRRLLSECHWPGFGISRSKCASSPSLRTGSASAARPLREVNLSGVRYM